MTYAGCHPAKLHVAHGLCDRCYQEQYRKDGRPRKRQYKVMPEFEADWRRIIPARTQGVQQNCVTAFPVDRCPRCRREGAMAYWGREARCAGVLGGCGATVYLVKESALAGSTAG